MKNNIRILMKSSILMLIVFATIIMGNKVYAADLAVTANGNKVTISSQYTGKVNVSVSGGKSSESSVWVEGNSQTITISDVAESGATVTVTPVSLADENGNLKNDVSAKSVKIAGTTKSTGTTESTTTKSSTTKTENSTTKTESTTKEPSFSKVEETVYATGNINVRKSYSADSDKLGTLQTGEQVTRTGVGDNGWSKVTYNGKTGYIKSTLLTKEEPKKSDDKSLKSLAIEGIELDPTFDPEITDYSITVGKDVEKLDIKAEKNNEKANVEITGNESLKDGDNIIKITVTAEDKTTRIYTINVTKQEAVKLGLSSLKVEGYTISPNFSTGVLEYKLTILDPNTNKINVTAVANAEKASVEVTGNTDLKQGSNVVNVTVKSEDGKETTTYKITVTKNAKATTASNSSDDNNWILYVGIGIIVVLVICIIVVVVRSRGNREYDDEYDEEDEETDEEDENNYDVRYTDKKNDDDFKFEDYNNFASKDEKKMIEDELFGKLPTETEDYSKFNDLQVTNNEQEDYLQPNDDNEMTEDYMQKKEEWDDDEYYDRPKRTKGKHSK